MVSALAFAALGMALLSLPVTATPAFAGATCGWSTFLGPQDTTGRAAPHGRRAASAIVDATGDRLVVFAGDGAVATGDPEDPGVVRTKNDVWSLSLDADPAWTEILPSGTAPDRRRDHTAIYDAPRERMIVFGGRGIDDNREQYWPDDSASVWSLSLDGTPSWSVLQAPALLSRRHSHAAAFDPVRDRMWVFGGIDNLSSQSVSPHLYYLDLAGTPQWTGVVGGSSQPGAITGHVLVYDSTRDRLLLFGGTRAFFGAMRDVWELNLSGTPTWSQLTVSGTPPPSATGPIRGFYDPVGDQLVVVGTTATYALALHGTPRWRTPRTHSSRAGASLAYEVSDHRMLLVGGEVAGDDFNDVLEDTPSPTVAWAVNPSNAGTVVADYHADCPETVTLTAVGTLGWGFSGWTGDASGSQNPITISLDTQKSVAAQFATVDVRDDERADVLFLSQNTPNPFDSRTTIRFTMPRPERVSLQVFDAAGRLVSTLLREQNRAAGRHDVEFRASDLPTGVYLYRLKVGDRVLSRTMLRLR